MRGGDRYVAEKEGRGEGERGGRREGMVRVRDGEWRLGDGPGIG